MNLVFKPHPQDATKIVCTFEGCLMGGLGTTNEEAFAEFVASINCLEAAARMHEHALAVARGLAPIPGSKPREQKSNLIVPAHMAPPPNLNLKR